MSGISRRMRALRITVRIRASAMLSVISMWPPEVKYRSMVCIRISTQPLAVW